MTHAPATMWSAGDPTQMFQLVEKLGQGSYGEVYSGVERSTGRLVAVKIVPIEGGLLSVGPGSGQEGTGQGGAGTGAAGGLKALLQEIDTLRSVSAAHPNIVAYYGSYISPQGDLWIIMEQCSGGSISDLMTAADLPGLTEEQVADAMVQVVDGLAFLHAQRVVHRDLKASNILLTEDGVAKLADFGVAAQMTSSISKRRTVVGSPYWMAPEVIQESAYDARADIWSLGITALELAEGRPPHADVHPMRALFLIPTKPPPTLREPSAWSEAFADFLHLCLQKNPLDRPPAARLLEHPFLATARRRIADDGMSFLLAELVDSCMPALQEARKAAIEQDEAAQQAQKEKEQQLAAAGDGGAYLQPPQATSQQRAGTGSGQYPASGGSLRARGSTGTGPALELPSTSGRWLSGGGSAGGTMVAHPPADGSAASGTGPLYGQSYGSALTSAAMQASGPGPAGSSATGPFGTVRVSSGDLFSPEILRPSGGTDTSSIGLGGSQLLLGGRPVDTGTTGTPVGMPISDASTSGPGSRRVPVGVGGGVGQAAPAIDSWKDVSGTMMMRTPEPPVQAAVVQQQQPVAAEPSFLAYARREAEAQRAEAERRAQRESFLEQQAQALRSTMAAHTAAAQAPQQAAGATTTATGGAVGGVRRGFIPFPGLVQRGQATSAAGGPGMPVAAQAGTGTMQQYVGGTADSGPGTLLPGVPFSYAEAAAERRRASLGAAPGGTTGTPTTTTTSMGGASRGTASPSGRSPAGGHRRVGSNAPGSDESDEDEGWAELGPSAGQGQQGVSVDGTAAGRDRAPSGASAGQGKRSAVAATMKQLDFSRGTPRKEQAAGDTGNGMAAMAATGAVPPLPGSPDEHALARTQTGSTSARSWQTAGSRTPVRGGRSGTTASAMDVGGADRLSTGIGQGQGQGQARDEYASLAEAPFTPAASPASAVSASGQGLRGPHRPDQQQAQQSRQTAVMARLDALDALFRRDMAELTRRYDAARAKVEQMLVEPGTSGGAGAMTPGQR